MTEAIDATEGRVYGGARNLIHIPDGERQQFGAWLAQQLDNRMRNQATGSGVRTEAQAWGDSYTQAKRQPLCPGCYMVAIIAMAVTLAERNGQSVTELGNSLSMAFDAIAKNGTGERNMEWIDVLVDPPEPRPVDEAEMELRWAAAVYPVFPL